MAVEILERVSQDDIARARYDSRLRWILDRNSYINEADRIKKEAEDIRREGETIQKNAILAMLSLNKFTVEEISKALNVSIDVVLKYK
ncbi:MAG: hypothetical protein ACRC7N_04545 [Clostridium sp.]